MILVFSKAKLLIIYLLKFTLQFPRDLNITFLALRISFSSIPCGDETESELEMEQIVDLFPRG